MHAGRRDVEGLKAEAAKRKKKRKEIPKKLSRPVPASNAKAAGEERASGEVWQANARPPSLALSVAHYVPEASEDLIDLVLAFSNSRRSGGAPGSLLLMPPLTDRPAGKRSLIAPNRGPTLAVMAASHTRLI